MAEYGSGSGAVRGHITAAGRLEILCTGKVWGDVEVGSFLLDEDGYFRGKLAMQDEPEPPTFGEADKPAAPEITSPKPPEAR